METVPHKDKRPDLRGLQEVAARVYAAGPATTRLTVMIARDVRWGDALAVMGELSIRLDADIWPDEAAFERSVPHPNPSRQVRWPDLVIGVSAPESEQGGRGKE